MSDRGSATANHYDHVHVSVYGSRGTDLSRSTRTHSADQRQRDGCFDFLRSIRLVNHLRPT